MSSVSLPSAECLSALKRCLPEGAGLRVDPITGHLIIDFGQKLDSEIPRDSGSVTLTRPTAITPAFLRLPKKKTLCPYSGLSRSMMDSLVRPSASNNYKPLVRSSKVKHSGVKGRRGAVLVEAESLFQYLASLSRTDLPA